MQRQALRALVSLRCDDELGGLMGASTNTGKNGKPSSLAPVLDHAIAWGLPASPLFMAILMMLAHAPYASPITEPSTFYLVCMAGALMGFAACAVLPTWQGSLPTVICWLSGALLEVGWFVLLAGEKSASATVLLAGSFLVGLSTACLLVLWLCVGQTDSVICEVAKLAASFTVAFMVYSLFGIIPHAGSISYLFPVATCIPLAIRLRKNDLNEGATAPSDRSTLFATIPQLLSASAFLIGVGAGFMVLGFGGAQVELGMGLTALVLVAAFVAPNIKDRISAALGRIATPLMVIALCLTVLLNDTGNPFAFFLAGCAAFVAWLFLRFRYNGSRLAVRSPRSMAAFLGWVTLCAGFGIGAGHFGLELMDAWNVRGNMAPIALVIYIAVADFLLKATLTSRSTERPRLNAAAVPPIDASKLAEDFGLSPREAQIAALLCENRSVSYICATLDLATSTTKTHVRHVYEKTGVHSRSELQLLAEHLNRAGDSKGRARNAT